MGSIILIPAFEPDEQLLHVLDRLICLGSRKIVVVNDGSSSSCDELFTRIAALPELILLTHRENKGKGAALRTGFKYILDQQECTTVITADADGQHRAEDIHALAGACRKSPGKVMLGVRQFDGYVPLRSRLGNNLTRKLCKILFQLDLSDTQTGLRGIPFGVLESLCSLKSERYSYELEMLLWLNDAGVHIDEFPISTVYEQGNESSHFRPLQDSAHIYGTLLRWWLTRHRK